MIKSIIEILQNNLGGIKRIEFSTLENSDFSDTSAIEVIPHRRHTAQLEAGSGVDVGGFYSDIRLSFQVPQKRDDVNDLIDSLANTTFAVRITDNNDHLTILAPARISYSYRSGTTPTEANGYDISIEAVAIPAISRARPVVYDDTPPIVGDENVNGDPPIFINVPPPEDESAAVPGEVPTVGDEVGTNNPCANILINPTVIGDQINANIYNLPDPHTIEIRQGSTVVGTALPYTFTQSGVYTIAVISTGVCEKVRDVSVEYVDPAQDFTISISIVGDEYVAITDAPAPSYLWEYEDTTGTRTEISQLDRITPTDTGIYHLTITDGITKTTHRLYVNEQLSVRITNLNEISNATGAIQTINGPGNVFLLDYDPSRYIIDRNGDVMEYIAGAAASTLDVNQYSYASGSLVFSSIFPLTSSDTVTINPV